MKKLLILSLLLSSTNIFAAELSNYEEIKSAVVNGKTIRIAINFDQCTTISKATNHVNFGLGIFSPNEIIIDREDHIDASLLHFTMNDPHLPGKSIYQYARYTITQDNIIKLETKALDAATFTPLTDGFTFNCKIATAAKVYG